MRTQLVLTAIAGAALLMSASHEKSAGSGVDVNFVRPGLVMKVTGASVAADGTIKAKVRLTDPKGLPLDRDGVTTPGSVSVSLVAAYIPNGQTQYTSYTTRTATSPITGVTTAQAGADSGGVWTKTAEGEYEYTFKTRAPKGFDSTATHSIGIYGSRSLTEFDMGTQYDDDVYNFVPDGTAVKTVRDVVRMGSCNNCHHDQGFHGGSRRSMEMCVLCHTPQTIDPDTGNTMDMPVMTHKIHMGSSLPSVKAGGKYKIIGHNQTVADFSAVQFPADARNCSACHQSGPAQADNVFKPNRAACGACHDNVNFETGANHVDLPQRTDNMCSTCHMREGELEFDTSVVGAHTIPRFSKTLKGVVFELLAVDGAGPGKSPTVTFSIKDKAGNPIPISTMARLNLVLAGPNSDYASYVSESALKAGGPGDGRYFWTFAAKLPDNATGSYTIGIEGRRDAVLMQGTTKEQTIREVGQNKVIYFAVDGGPVQKRRTIVTLQKCNACHGSLSLHGDNRNAIEQCVLCHNPNTEAGGTTVDFRTMVHRIHTGEELSRPYKLGNTVLSEFAYPGDRRQCGACHVNGSEQLPLADNLLPVKDAASPLNPLPPATAACTGCHDSRTVLAHADANTSKLGESCAACHGPDADQSVTKAHSR
jgi:OmcA/MtrC family decaheme c-type cytochrome